MLKYSFSCDIICHKGGDIVKRNKELYQTQVLEVLSNILKMMKSWKEDKRWIRTITTIIIFCSVVIGITLLILYTENPWGYVKEGQDWIGFWGSISGSIIGGVITVIVLKKTIEFEREKLVEERKLQVLPYLKYTVINKKVNKLRCNEYTDILLPSNSLCNEGKKVHIHQKTIFIKNIGQGAIMNLNIIECTFQDDKQIIIHDFRCIDKGETLALCLKIQFFDSTRLYKNLDLSFKIAYTNINGDYYEQELELKFSIFYDEEEPPISVLKIYSIGVPKNLKKDIIKEKVSRVLEYSNNEITQEMNNEEKMLKITKAEVYYMRKILEKNKKNSK